MIITLTISTCDDGVTHKLDGEAIDRQQYQKAMKEGKALSSDSARINGVEYTSTVLDISSGMVDKIKMGHFE